MSECVLSSVNLLVDTFNKTSVLDLPDEILICIFSHLSVKERLLIERVCRKWCLLGRTFHWKWPTKFDPLELQGNLRCDVFEEYDMTTEILPTILSRCGKSLTQLILEPEDVMYQLRCEVFTLIGKSCPNLTDIRLNLIQMREDPTFAPHFVNLAKDCPNLKQVCIAQSDQLNDAVLSEFLQHCCSLENLVLRSNELLKGGFLNDVNTKLKGFYVHKCMYIRFNAVEQLMDTCHQIEGFGIVSEYYNDFSVPVFVKLLNHYKDTLKILYLNSFMKLSEWYGVANLMQNLELISLAHTRGVDDYVMKQLAKCCKKLTALDISFTTVSDVGVAALAGVPSLKVLDLSGLYLYGNFTGESLKSLAIKGQLERLYYYRINPNGIMDAPLSEESCIALADCCPNFQMLNVNGIRYITDKMVRMFSSSVQRGFLKGPVTLHVANTLVTQEVKHCDKLNLIFETSRKFIIDDFDHMSKPYVF